MRSFLSKHRHFRFSIIKQCGLLKSCVLALSETSVVGGRSCCFITARWSRSPGSKCSLHWHMRWGKGWNPSSSSVLHWYRVYVCVGERGILLLLPNGRKCLDFPLGLFWQHSRRRGRMLHYHWVVVKVHAPTQSPLTSWSGRGSILLHGKKERYRLAPILLWYHPGIPKVFSDTTLPSPVGLCWLRSGRGHRYFCDVWLE